MANNKAENFSYPDAKLLNVMKEFMGNSISNREDGNGCLLISTNGIESLEKLRSKEKMEVQSMTYIKNPEALINALYMRAMVINDIDQIQLLCHQMIFIATETLRHVNLEANRRKMSN